MELCTLAYRLKMKFVARMFALEESCLREKKSPVGCSRKEKERKSNHSGADLYNGNRL